MRGRIEPQLLRRLSVRRVLDVIRSEGPCSRAELSRHSGISAPTVSKVVADLLEARLLEEGDALRPALGRLGRPALGRPGRLVRLATKRTRVLGLVLDARRSELVPASLDGELGAGRQPIETPGTYPELLEALADAITPQLDPALAGEVLGLGISVPGLLDRSRQEILLSPNLPITNQQSPARDLEQRLGLPCTMIQESHALCLAEGLAGAARGLTHYAVMDVSTGLGLGVMENGELLSGRRGLAGELGHWTVDPRGRRCGCGNLGCLETVATDSSLLQRVRERTGQEVDLASLSTMLDESRSEVHEELERTIAHIAIAVAAVVNLFNPQAVFVYGELFDLKPDLFEDVRARALERALAPSATGCRIERTRRGKLDGAVAGILERVLPGSAHRPA